MNLLPQERFEAVTRFVVDGLSIREISRQSGVSKQTVMKIKQGYITERRVGGGNSKGASERRYLAALANRNPPDADGNPTCMEDDYPSMVRSRRFLALGISPRAKPSGHTVDVRCGNPRCYAPEHTYLRPLKSIKESPWKDLGRRIDALPLDGEILLADIDRYSEVERAKLRTNLMFHTSATFAIRSQPRGGVKIIRTGTHGCAYLGIEGNKSDTRHPVLVQMGAVKNTIGSIFLGQLRDTWDKPKGEREERVAKCSERACAFPCMDGASVCHYHWEWDRATISYPTKLELFQREAYSKKADNKRIDTHHALFHTGWLPEDKYGFMLTTTMRHGSLVRRSHAEVENDEWWKENVTALGIETPGIIMRKTSKELKQEMEAMIDESLANYSAMQSELNMKAFWRVTKEPKPLHDDPFHPNAPRLKIGDGAAVSLRGKMRRGGGHGLGIRKKQRKRAAGWTSSRHNHDPQYFTRDTVRDMEYDEFSLMQAVDESTEDEEYDA